MQVVGLSELLYVVEGDEGAQVPFGREMIKIVVGVVIVGELIERGGSPHFLIYQCLLRRVNR